MTPRVRHRIKQAKVIIIDEISLLGGTTFAKFEALARLADPDHHMLYFAGKQVLHIVYASYQYVCIDHCLW